jgi:hypothetical protein
MALNRNVARDVGNGRHDGSVGGRSSSVPENAAAGPAMMPGTQPSWAKRVRIDGLEVLPPIGQAQPIITYFVSLLLESRMRIAC